MGMVRTECAAAGRGAVVGRGAGLQVVVATMSSQAARGRAGDGDICVCKVRGVGPRVHQGRVDGA